MTGAPCSLHVRVRPRLVNDGLDNARHAILDLNKCGKHVTADEWHNLVYD